MDIELMRRVCNRRPLNKYLYLAIVKRGETRTTGGVVMPENAEFSERYRVIRAASDCVLVKEGDEVILRGSGHEEEVIEGHEFTVAQESNVIAIIDDIPVEG